MTWHAEVITLTLRRYVDGQSYEARSKFASVATAQLLGGKRAFISGFLNDGTLGPISRQDWADLVTLLRDQFGIERVTSERRSAPREYDTGAAPLS
jgi:hypothetical protein